MATHHQTVGAGTDADRVRTARTLAIAMAVVFTAIGIIGFFITGFDNFFSHDTGETLLGFEINGAHNLVHLAFGLLGFALVQSRRGVLTYGLVIGLGYAGALIYGLIATGKTWDFLSINAADNWLHLALALVGFVIAYLASEPRDRLATDTTGVTDRSPR